MISVQKQEKLQNHLGTDARHRTTLNTTGGGSLNTANVQKQENNKIPFVKKVTEQPFRCLEEREHCNRFCGFQIFKQCFLSKLFITQACRILITQAPFSNSGWRRDSVLQCCRTVADILISSAFLSSFTIITFKQPFPTRQIQRRERGNAKESHLCFKQAFVCYMLSQFRCFSWIETFSKKLKRTVHCQIVNRACCRRVYKQSGKHPF